MNLFLKLIILSLEKTEENETMSFFDLATSFLSSFFLSEVTTVILNISCVPLAESDMSLSISLY